MWSLVSPVLAVRPRGDTARSHAPRAHARPSPSSIRTVTVGPAVTAGSAVVVGSTPHRAGDEALVGSPVGALPPVGDCTLPRRRPDPSTAARAGSSGTLDGEPGSGGGQAADPGQAQARTRRSTRSTLPYRAIPRRAISTSVANSSGMSKRLPRARLIGSASPSSPPVPLGHDGPHDCKGDPDPEAADDPGQRRGQLHQGDPLAPRNPVAACHLEEAAVHAANGDHHADRHGEEDDEGDNDRAGEQPVAEPEGDERRQGKDRHGLR